MDGETSIGTNIRRIRHWRGLSLEAAAGLAGFSKGYLSMIENGERGWTGGRRCPRSPGRCG